MNIASLVVAIAALLVSGGSLYWARHSVLAARRSADASEQSATSADRSAVAAEGSLALDAARLHEQRRPRLTGRVDTPDGGLTYQLLISLHPDDSPLTALDVTIRREQGVSFDRGHLGVVDVAGSEAVPLRAFAHGPRNEPAGVLPGEEVTWWAVVGRPYHTHIYIDATCYGPDGESWPGAVEAPVQPRLMDTIA